jgi:FAD/FMN-containing dehydrogenase
VEGTLIAVEPPLASCFGWAGMPPDQAVCDANIANFSNSYWRASQPGALQEPNWEQDPITGADCFDASKPCSLGNIAPYAVAAVTAEQVAIALKFAATHNIRVIVRASGHEYQGRSAGANGLLVWVKAMHGVTVLNEYTACPGDTPRTAIATRPGTSWGEAYAAADMAKVTVVGGSEISVSSCGGYTLGGGHSWQGPAFGMAVDNVLSFDVVLANGTLVTASACSHSDLFWALRGGGGGTFGVVTQCTYATHPFPTAGAAGAFITIELLQKPASLAMALNGLLDWATAINAPGSGSPVTVGGYFIPDFDAPETPAHSHLSLLLGFNGTVDQGNAALEPLGAWLTTVPAYLTVIGADVLPFTSLMQFHEYYDDSSESTGQPQTLGSRLIPYDTIINDTARAIIADTLAIIAYDVGGLTGMLVAGGAVAATLPNSTGLNPAWRTAAVHIAWGVGWALNETLARQAAIFEGVSSLTDAMRNLTPGSGAYWSESDYMASEWQEELYGNHYSRLQAIKKAVDPNGIFTGHHTVELPLF